MSQQRGPNGIMLFNSVGGCSLVLDLFIGCAGSSFLGADRNEVFFFSCRQAEATPRCNAQASHFLIAVASLVAEHGLYAHRLQ